MSYLLGDSTDSGLDFNYLEFTKDVVGCAAVLVETELELVTTVDKRRARESERAAIIKTVEELGQRATASVASAAKEQAGTPAGRCAAAIVAAVKEAVDREIAAARAALGGDL